MPRPRAWAKHIFVHRDGPLLIGGCLGPEQPLDRGIVLRRDRIVALSATDGGEKTVCFDAPRLHRERDLKRLRRVIKIVHPRQRNAKQVVRIGCRVLQVQRV